MFSGHCPQRGARISQFWALVEEFWLPKEKLFEYGSYIWKCKGLFHNLNRVSVWGKVHSAVKRNIPGIVAIPLPLADNHGMFPKTRSYAGGKGRICCLKQSLGVTAPCQENPSTEIRKAQVTSSDWSRGSFTSTKAINLVGLCYNSPTLLSLQDTRTNNV